MFQYAVRRVLWMLPTFFAISLVVFALVNLAPGNPGQSGGSENVGTGKAVQSESVIIFRRQFNLDKPILFNTRFLLDQAEIRTWIVQANQLEPATPADVIAARTHLEDGGPYLARHLYALLDGDADPRVQRLAADYLVTAASLPLRMESTDDPPSVRTANREREAFNKVFDDWRCPPDDATCLTTTTAQWRGWWAEHHALYEYTAAECVGAFLFDTRFATYWKKLVTLDLGVSYNTRRAVLDTVVEKFKYSMSLSLTSILIAYLIAVPLGVYSAVKSGSRGDTVLTTGLFVLYSLPTFFTGTVLLQLFSQGTPVAWFPTGDFQSTQVPVTTLGQLGDIVWHLVLPVATSSSVALAALSRYARTGVIDVIRADYIRTARAKGLEEPVVIIKHAVRNGMIPILTLLGGILPVLVSGSVVIEMVFNIPGMGQLLVESITTRDYNVVMAILLASAVLTLVGILISDLSYAIVDPRINLD
jgi:peptide/nickel transport system permease protein